MTRSRTFLAFVGILAYASAASAHILYITADGSSIRVSDGTGGMVWNDFVTGGQNYRGIDVDPVNHVVFALDGLNNASISALRAFDSSGTLLSTAAVVNAGSSSVRPLLDYFNGFVFINTASPAAQRYQAISFSGSAFNAPTTWIASAHDWSASDILTIQSTSGTNYLFANGTSGTAMRRYTLGSQMLLSAAPGIPNSAQAITTTGPANYTFMQDFTFTPSGRLLVLGTNGIMVSAANQYESTSINLTLAFAYVSATNTLTGSAGASAREMILLDNNIYVANATHIFRYEFNDTTGTVTFQAAAPHGFNTASIHLAGIVPEPSTVGLFGISLAALALIRRRALHY